MIQNTTRQISQLYRITSDPRPSEPTFVANKIVSSKWVCGFEPRGLAVLVLWAQIPCWLSLLRRAFVTLSQRGTESLKQTARGRQRRAETKYERVRD
jgi:hypothetical protein